MLNEAVHMKPKITLNHIYDGILFTFSTITLGSAALLSLKLVYIFFINPMIEIPKNNLYFVAGLFLVGISGSFIRNVLERVFSKKINQYLENEDTKEIFDKMLKTELSKKEQINLILENIEFQKYISIVNKIDANSELSEISKNFEIKKELFPLNNNLLKTHKTVSNKELDTVVVPAGWSMDFNRRYLLYFCQHGRTFKSTQFMAFYANKKIQFVARYSKISQEDIKKILADNVEIKAFLDDNAPENTKLLDFYKLDVSDIQDSGVLSIPHNLPSALVQNRIYTNFNSLLSAQTSNDIQRG